LSRDPRQSHQRSAQATLVALVEFKRYLDNLEKDLSRMSKKYSNREIAQSVGFVAAGIHEALSYLEIVKKVIVKTERAVAKSNAISVSPTKSDNSS
jgi:NADH/NAD ratio-sensing transcriptional regulator Rex